MPHVKKCYEIAFESKIETTTVYARDKKKGTVHPRTGHEGPEGEQRYSSTLSLTSALGRMGGQRHPSAVLPPGKRSCTHCVGG
jgi:hypothetical protein